MGPRHRLAASDGNRRPADGKLRLALAAALLTVGATVAVGCSQTVHGKAAIAADEGWADAPQITNIGVIPRAGGPSSGSSTAASSTSRGSGPSSGQDVNGYISSKGLSIQPVPAGKDLTVGVRAPKEWQKTQPDDDSTQLQLVRGSGSAVTAKLFVSVYRVIGSFDSDELLQAAGTTIANAGQLQQHDTSAYQGNPSAVGLVSVTPKQGPAITEIYRFVLVEGPSPSQAYLVQSQILCPAENWDALSNELLKIDSGLSFDS